jgi:hypothetical protein
MKKNIRVALSFATFPDDQLNSFAILVIACVKTNPLFPALPVSVIALTALQTAFQNAITAAAQGGPMETAEKNEARDPLVSGLRQTAAYVQSLALDNVSQVLSSGFDVVNPNNTQSPLTQPVFTLDNSMGGQLAVYLQSRMQRRIRRNFPAARARGRRRASFPTRAGLSLPASRPARSIMCASAPSAAPRNIATGARRCR